MMKMILEPKIRNLINPVLNNNLFSMLRWTKYTILIITEEKLVCLYKVLYFWNSKIRINKTVAYSQFFKRIYPAFLLF